MTEVLWIASVIILPNISKIFERCIFRQLYSFAEMPMWFGKVYSTQYSLLLAMLKKWKTAVNKRKAFGELFIDLFKAFDCLSHDLLFAKLHADGFIIAALTLIHSYLTNRKQRAKVKLLNSPWTEVLFGVPQRYILGTFIAQHLSV